MDAAGAMIFNKQSELCENCVVVIDDGGQFAAVKL